MVFKALDESDMKTLWSNMPGFSEAVLLGTYITGLETATPPNVPAVGLVWPGLLIVTSRTGAAEWGRIDLGEIRDVTLAASDEVEKMDLGRALAVGIFALGWKKRVRTAQLLLALSTPDGRERGVLFDFGETGWEWRLAKEAHERLTALATKMNQAGTAMRKCPYCAEDIRREAILCRYCGSSVTPG